MHLQGTSLVALLRLLQTQGDVFFFQPADSSEKPRLKKSQVENDLDRILRQSRGFGSSVSIRSVRCGVSCFGLYWWMLGLEPMALALKKRSHFLMWEVMLRTWIFQGVCFMDDIWGAGKKPIP